MGRVLLGAIVALSAACEATLDDRIAELDALATVDCGNVGDCSSQEYVEGVVACMRENLAAGTPAKAFLILGHEEVAYVYALDGSFVTLEGYDFDGPQFTEKECQDMVAGPSSPMTCWKADTMDCVAVRDWND